MSEKKYDPIENRKDIIHCLCTLCRTAADFIEREATNENFKLTDNQVAIIQSSANQLQYELGQLQRCIDNARQNTDSPVLN
jgi:hypothetical protein